MAWRLQKHNEISDRSCEKLHKLQVQLNGELEDWFGSSCVLTLRNEICEERTVLLNSLFSVSYSPTLFLPTPVSVNLCTRMLRRLQIKSEWSRHGLVLTTTYRLATTRYCRKCDVKIVNRTTVIMIRWSCCKSSDLLTTSRPTRKPPEIFKRSFVFVSLTWSIDHWWENSSTAIFSADLP